MLSGNEAGTRATTWYTWSGRVRSIYKTKDKEGKWKVGAQRPYIGSDESQHGYRITVAYTTVEMGFQQPLAD